MIRPLTKPLKYCIAVRYTPKSQIKVKVRPSRKERKNMEWIMTFKLEFFLSCGAGSWTVYCGNSTGLGSKQ